MAWYTPPSMRIHARPSPTMLALAVVCVAATFFACKDNTPGDGASPPPSTGTDPRCSDLLYEVPASCRACEQEECCPAIMGCQGSLDCETIHACVAGCPPSRRDECEARCTQAASQFAQGLYFTMRTCLDSAVRCSTVCELPDAGADGAEADAGVDAASEAASP
jgi:hypothetical protein